MRKNIGKKRPFLVRVGQSTQTVSPKRKFHSDELDATKYLTQNEIQKLFSVITNRRDRAIFRLMYHRGLRAHEVRLHQMADFRDRDGVLYVHRGKGSISREHSLCDEELRCLRSYFKHERGFGPGPLFPSRQGGKGISRAQLDRLMKDYCQLAGIAPEKAHCHALKHSCGTHLAERGSEAEEIQDWLGHRDIKSTAIYMHFSPSRRRGAYERNRDWR